MGGGKKKEKDTGRKSVTDKYDQSGRKSRIPAYPAATMLVDLQVFVVPREKWVLSRRLYRHNIVEEGISFGFVRVLPQLSIHNLRRELALQLGPDVVPRDFVIVRSVGNIFVQLKPKQEIELKVKNFLPPFTTDPEIYLLEVLPSDDLRMLSPLPMLLREETPPHICHELCHHSRARTRKVTSVVASVQAYTSTRVGSTMNITIILPPIQQPPPPPRQQSPSPQPTTTPFPAFSISPSPTNLVYVSNSRATTTTSNYCPECHSVTNNEVFTTIYHTTEQNPDFLDEPVQQESLERQEDEDEQPGHEDDEDDNRVLRAEDDEEDDSRVLRAEDDEEDVHVETLLEELTRDEPDSSTREPVSPEVNRPSDPRLVHQDSIDRSFTGSPSSPETVIHVEPEPIPNDDDTGDPYEQDFAPEETVVETKNQSRSERKPETIFIPLTDTDPVLEPTVVMTPKIRRVRSGGSGRKRKRLVYPDPRRPSNYPQRLNKVTLARQALAREKRRVYIEDRIQQYLRKSNVKIPPRKYRHPTLSTVPEGTDTEQRSKVTSLLPTETLANLQRHHSHSLPDLDSSNYYISHPNIPLASELTSSSIPIARIYTRRSPFKSLPPPSPTTVPLPSVVVAPGGASESSMGSQSDLSRHGYYYSFRVRENGPVQMFDKSVQTVHAEFSHGYTLEFSNVTSTHTPARVKTVVDSRDKTLREITENVQLRHDAELRRAELVQRANELQTRIKEKREKITRRHEFWHKKYIEESALTRPLEASCNTLRSELNTVHRRLLAHLEGRDLPLRLRDGPSKKANYKIMAARLQHEIKELQQKVKAAKLRLESEIKLKEQADRETREMRNDLSHKKVVMSLARSQAATLPVVQPKPISYDHLIPRSYDPIHARTLDPIHARTYDPIHSRPFDPIHSRSYESLYSRVYDPVLGY